MKRLCSRRTHPWREWPLIESVFVAAFLCMLAIALLSAINLTHRVAASRVTSAQATR